MASKLQELIDNGDVCRSCLVFLDGGDGVARECERCAKVDRYACHWCGEKLMSDLRCLKCYPRDEAGRS